MAYQLSSLYRVSTIESAQRWIDTLPFQNKTLAVCCFVVLFFFTENEQRYSWQPVRSTEPPDTTASVWGRKRPRTDAAIYFHSDARTASQLTLTATWTRCSGAAFQRAAAGFYRNTTQISSKIFTGKESEHLCRDRRPLSNRFDQSADGSICGSLRESQMWADTNKRTHN